LAWSLERARGRASLRTRLTSAVTTASDAGSSVKGSCAVAEAVRPEAATTRDACCARAAGALAVIVTVNRRSAINEFRILLFTLTLFPFPLKCSENNLITRQTLVKTHFLKPAGAPCSDAGCAPQGWPLQRFLPCSFSSSPSAPSSPGRFASVSL